MACHHRAASWCTGATEARRHGSCAQPAARRPPFGGRIEAIPPAGHTMDLTPREKDKLLIFTAALLAAPSAAVVGAPSAAPGAGAAAAGAAAPVAAVQVAQAPPALPAGQRGQRIDLPRADPQTQDVKIPVGAEPDGSAVSLDATVIAPAQEGRHPAVLLAHGFGGSKADLVDRAHVEQAAAQGARGGGCGHGGRLRQVHVTSAPNRSFRPSADHA